MSDESLSPAYGYNQKDEQPQKDPDQSEGSRDDSSDDSDSSTDSDQGTTLYFLFACVLLLLLFNILWMMLVLYDCLNLL